MEAELNQIQEYRVFYGERAEYTFLGNNIVSKKLGAVIDVEYSADGFLKRAWIQHTIPGSFDGYKEEMVSCPP